MGPFRADAAAVRRSRRRGVRGRVWFGARRPTPSPPISAAAIDGADAILVCLPTFAHGDIAAALAALGTRIPVVLNPGHTGGALAFCHAFASRGAVPPPIAEFSDATAYVGAQIHARQRDRNGTRQQRSGVAALPGGAAAADAARTLFAGANVMSDVLACDLANVNMVLHAPGAVLGAAWIEATRGDYTFYVQGT